MAKVRDFREPRVQALPPDSSQMLSTKTRGAARDAHVAPIPEATADELTEFWLQPQPPSSASRLYPPDMIEDVFERGIPRSFFVRIIRTLGMVVLMSFVNMLYIGIAKPGRPDTIYGILFFLLVALSVVTWYRSKYKAKESVKLRGYFTYLLAEMPVLAEGFKAKVMLADTEDIDAGDLMCLEDRKPTKPLALSSEQDITFELSSLLVRNKDGAGYDNRMPSHAEQAVRIFRMALVRALNLEPTKVQAFRAELSENFDEDSTGAIDTVTIAILGGQVLDVDAICQAIGEASEAMLQRYDVTIDV